MFIVNLHYHSMYNNKSYKLSNGIHTSFRLG